MKAVFEVDISMMMQIDADPPDSMQGATVHVINRSTLNTEYAQTGVSNLMPICSCK